ncbi:MAG: glycosyl hydrolase family 28 protein [Luteolibacter sp.]
MNRPSLKLRSKQAGAFLICLTALSTLPLLAMDTSLADHGAINDGTTLNTAAMQSAIDAAAAGGGGILTIPQGTWLIGSVSLKSNVTLHLEPGAVLKGSPNIKDYPANGFYHIEFKETRSLLYAIGQHDIRITGDGIIDLGGEAFFQWDKINSALPPEKEALLEPWQRAQCTVESFRRPNQPIFFHDCQRVRIDGVKIRNAPCWTLSFSSSRDLQIRGVVIDNPQQAPNNDGIHFSASKDIIISDCIIRTGDDALAFTCITDAKEVCERIAVTNCTLSSRSAAIRLGHLYSKIRDVVISNIVIHNSNRGFAIQVAGGGWVENVRIHDVILETNIKAGAWWGKGEPFLISAVGVPNHPSAAGSQPGRIRNIQISHVSARADNSVVIVGQNRNVSDITIDDLDLTLRQSPNRSLYGGFLDIAPAPLIENHLSEGRLPWLHAESVTGLTLRNIHFRQSPDQSTPLDLQPALKDVEQTP